MRIGSSAVTMASEHTLKKVQMTQTASVMELRGNQVKLDPNNQEKSVFQQLMEASQSQDTQKAEKTRETYDSNGLRTITSIKELRMALLDNILSFLEKNRRKIFGNIRPMEAETAMDFARLQNSGNVGQTSGIYVVQKASSSFYSEQETTAFVTDGRVTTKDGREINFNVSFEMSRSFEQTVETYSEESVLMCDPLVFNFEGNTAELTDMKFLFDLDGDGKEEEISNLSSGSGFLALDKNNDGKINDGTELFGTQSGNGFKDLAIYDEDGNGWIDEDDSVFKQLKIWTKNEKGEDSLIAIADMGIGAINLDSVSTQFSEKDEFNNLLGAIRRTGMFLYENGSAGTVQHVDMAI